MRELALLAILALLAFSQVWAQLVGELHSAHGPGIAPFGFTFLAAVLAFAFTFPLILAFSFEVKRSRSLTFSLHPLLFFSNELLVMAVAASISVRASPMIAHGPADLGLIVPRLPAGSLGTAFSKALRPLTAEAILSAALTAPVSLDCML